MPYCACGFRHDERRARHALDTACDREVGVACGNRSRCGADGIEARTAESVDGGRGRTFRQSREQHGHARDVAIVFARLIRTAEVDVVDRVPVELRVPLSQRTQDVRCEIVGAYRRKRAAEFPDRRPDAVAKKYFIHEAAGSTDEGDVPRARAVTRLSFDCGAARLRSG